MKPNEKPALKDQERPPEGLARARPGLRRVYQRRRRRSGTRRRRRRRAGGSTPLFAGPPPSPGGLVDQTEEELRNLREALFTVKTALVEMRTRSSLVSDSCDSDDARAPL